VDPERIGTDIIDVISCAVRYGEASSDVRGSDGASCAAMTSASASDLKKTGQDSSVNSTPDE
jgi:hypothetical protein